MSRKKKIAYVILAVLVIIQFFRPTRNNGIADTPDDVTHATTVSPEVKTILQTSCYDCHSDHTNYPWYTNIQPVGWWMQHHVDEGKGDLNFSHFSSYGISRKMRRYRGISNAVGKDEMPLDSYLWIHHDAKLSDAQKKTLTDWANANRTALEQQYPDSIPKPRK